MIPALGTLRARTSSRRTRTPARRSKRVVRSCSTQSRSRAGSDRQGHSVLARAASRFAGTRAGAGLQPAPAPVRHQWRSANRWRNGCCGNSQPVAPSCPIITADRPVSTGHRPGGVPLLRATPTGIQAGRPAAGEVDCGMSGGVTAQPSRAAPLASGLPLTGADCRLEPLPPNVRSPV